MIFIQIINIIMLIENTQNVHIKLVLSVVLLLLLLNMISYAPPFLQKVLAASSTHIDAAGDWGCSGNTEKTVNNVKNMNPGLLLALGDYSYEKTSTCWLDLIKPVDSITKINFGNHEGEGNNLSNSYLNHFGLSKQYYSFDINNIHVLTMATEQKFDTNSEQYNFVVQDLRKAANNPDIKWIIVTMHYPFYSSPNTCGESDCAGNKESRDIFHPLFDKYGVDLVLQGHVHNYQRSYPLKFNQESSPEPIVTSTAKTDYKNPNSVIFAIVGTGGVNLHGLSGSAPFMAYQQDSKFGILDMHVSDNQLDAKFVSNNGATLDHFSISKTVMKKIIERISDDTATDTKSKSISDKEDTKAKPISDKENSKAVPPSDKENSKVTVLSDKDPNAKPPSDKENKVTVLSDKDPNAKPPSDKENSKVTVLSDKDPNAKPPSDKDPNAKPLIVKDENNKPAITYKLKDDTVTDTKDKPLSDKVKDENNKPAITYKLKDDTVTDTKDKPLSEKQDTNDKPLSKVKEDKPAIIKELSNDVLTDDKPKSLHNEDKADLSNEDKSTNDKSVVGRLLGPSDNTDPVDNENIDHDGEKTTISNEADPFAGLK
jgi:hypothetical protein